MLREYKLTEIPELQVFGRTNGSRSPLTLFWTGSALEVTMRAGELWIEVETAFSNMEQWAAVVLNGEMVSRFPLPSGRHWLCLFRGMDPEREKTLRFVKEVQAMPNDPGTRLQIHGLRTDGSFLPGKKRLRRLEFIGDSITSCEGVVGAKEEEDWIPMFFSAAQGYPWQVADLCEADCRVISQSGWGVRSSWDNDPNCTLPSIYDMVCGPLQGEENLALGAHEPNDFAAWQPDVVIVNLGTNDGGATHQPAWQDPDTGERFQQTADEKGRAAFIKDAVSFLKHLREKNPEAYLLWAYGIVGREMAGAIHEAVGKYQTETGDLRVSFLLLPEMNEDTKGARNHPGKKAHENAAAVLADYLKTLWAEGK